MFYAVRLKEYDPRKGAVKLTYISAALGAKYVAGEGDQPSNFSIIEERKDKKHLLEIAELKKIEQFDVFECETLEEVHKLIKAEVNARLLEGRPGIAAKVAGEPTQIKEKTPKRDPKEMAKIFKPISAAEAAKKLEEENEKKANVPPENPEDPDGDDDDDAFGDEGGDLSEDLGASTGGRKPSTDPEDPEGSEDGGEEALALRDDDVFPEYDDITATQMKEFADKYEIEYPSRVSKHDLYELLKGAFGVAEEDEE